MGYFLSQIQTFRSCHVGWDERLEVAAAIEVVCEGWDLGSHKAFEAAGFLLNEKDNDLINELIEREGLRIDHEQVLAALARHSREVLADDTE